MQADLFTARNQAEGISIAPAPPLVPHAWPYPGMTPEDSARACIANSSEFADVVAAVVLRHGGDTMTGAEVLAAIPEDWRTLLGPWAHGSLSHRRGEARGVDVKYVHHEGGGGFHFEYRALDESALRPTGHKES